MKDIDVLNEYLSNLKVFINNLYNLHFNVTNSYQLHKRTEEYYDAMLDFYDEIGEAIKINGGYPLMNLAAVEDVSTIKSLKSMDYNDVQTTNILNNQFSYLVDYTEKLIKMFERDYYVQNKLIGILDYMKIQNWLIKQELK